MEDDPLDVLQAHGRACGQTTGQGPILESQEESGVESRANAVRVGALPLPATAVDESGGVVLRSEAGERGMDVQDLHRLRRAEPRTWIIQDVPMPALRRSAGQGRERRAEHPPHELANAAQCCGCGVKSESQGCYSLGVSD